MEPLKEFLLWCRENRIAVSRFKGGDVEVELADLELADQYADHARKQTKWSPEPVPEPRHIYEQLAKDIGLDKEPA